MHLLTEGISVNYVYLTSSWLKRAVQVLNFFYVLIFNDP